MPFSACRLRDRSIVPSSVAILLIGSLLAIANISQAGVLDFGTRSGPYGPIHGPAYYEEDGFRLTPTTAFEIDTAGAARPQTEGSMVAFRFSDEPAVLTNDNANPFRILSIDLAEYSTVSVATRSAVTVTMIATKQTGDVLTTSFTTDGIIDGGGPLFDFETVIFGPEWTNLASLSFGKPQGIGFTLDNIVYAIVPEPSTAVLFGLGLGMLARRSTTGDRRA